MLIHEVKRPKSISHGVQNPLGRAFLFLSIVKVSDGEIHRFGTGSITITVDTTGKGHTSRVVSFHDALLAVR